MIALRFIALALSFLLGIVLATIRPLPIPAPLLLLPAAAGLAALVWIWLRERQWRQSPIWHIILAAFLLGFPLGFWRTTQQLGPPAPDHLNAVTAELADWTEVTLVGMVAEIPEVRGDTELDLRIAVDELIIDGGQPITVDDGKVLVRAEMGRYSQPEDSLRFNELAVPHAYGYRIRLESKWRSPPVARGPGAFDMAQFLQQEGLTARLTAYMNEIEILEQSKGAWLKEIAFAAKSSFLNTYRQTIAAPASRLAAATTLGARRALDDVVYRGKKVPDTFRHAGVGHVLAVSGLHVTIINILLYCLLSLTGLKPRHFVPAIIIFLGIFALLTGARPSSVRAVIMNSTVLIAFAYFHFNLRQATYVGLALSSMFILLGSPMVLYAPSFLLSFGAVLSLVLISPTLERWMNLLKGWSLFLALIWCTVVLLLACSGLSFFLTPWNVLSLLGLLWLGILIGGKLNNRYPRFWKVGLHALPRTLRMFIAAQLAIQFGMMIPLSAWFFGQFPVAGIFVNLIAIPAVGVLVQLAMLTGLLGMIPLIGIYLAMPLGAATTVIGGFFLWMAQAGAHLFPFPAMPQPTLAWMIAYYVGLALVLVADSHRARIQGWLYRRWSREQTARGWKLAVWAPPLALVLSASIGMLSPKPSIRQVIVYDTWDFPVLSLIADSNTAATINAGSGFIGSSTLFSGVREAGAVRVSKAIITGFDPGIGNEGVTALAEKMQVDEILLPVVAENPEDYLKLVGDTYVLDNANKQRPWALGFQTAYADLKKLTLDRGIKVTAYSSDEPIPIADTWIEVLPGPERLPTRYVTAARTGIVTFDVAGFRWLVITDTLPDVFTEVVPDSYPVDILVLPTSDRHYYAPLINAAVKRCQPALVVISGGRPGKSFDPLKWAEGKPFTLLTTDQHGALVAAPQPDGSLKIRGYVSGQEIHLAHPVAQAE